MNGFGARWALERIPPRCPKNSLPKANPAILPRGHFASLVSKVGLSCKSEFQDLPLGSELGGWFLRNDRNRRIAIEGYRTADLANIPGVGWEMNSTPSTAALRPLERSYLRGRGGRTLLGGGSRSSLSLPGPRTSGEVAGQLLSACWVQLV